MKIDSSNSFICAMLVSMLVTSPLSGQSFGGPMTALPQEKGMLPAQNSGADNIGIKLRVIEGGELNGRANLTDFTGLTVAVSDLSGYPVADAAVLVRLPDTGRFEDGSHAAVRYSDQAGQVHFAAIHWDQTPGLVDLRITAWKGAAHGTILIDGISKATASTTVPPELSTVAQLLSEQGGTKLQQPSNSLRTAGTPAAARPAVDLIDPSAAMTPITGAADSPHHSARTKWIIVAAAAAAAAVTGIAIAAHGKAPSSSAASITQPTASVGKP